MAVPADAPTQADLRCTLDLCHTLHQSGSSVLMLDNSSSPPATDEFLTPYSEVTSPPLAYWAGGVRNLLQPESEEEKTTLLARLHAHYPWIVVLAPISALTSALTSAASRIVLLLPAQLDVIGAVVGRTRTELFPAPPDLIVYHPAGISPEVTPTRLAAVLGCTLIGTMQLPNTANSPCSGASECADALMGPTASQRQRDLKQRLATLLQHDRALTRNAAEKCASNPDQEAEQHLRQLMETRRRILEKRALVKRLDQEVHAILSGMRQQLDTLDREFQTTSAVSADLLTRHVALLSELQRQLIAERGDYQVMWDRYQNQRQHFCDRLLLPEELPPTDRPA